MQCPSMVPSNSLVLASALNGGGLGYVRCRAARMQIKILEISRGKIYNNYIKNCFDIER